MNANLVAALVNVALLGLFVALGWWFPAAVAAVCIAVSLTLWAVTQ